MKSLSRGIFGAGAVACSVMAALAFAASPGPATMYKWTDEDGKVHYSDKAPPDAPKGAAVLDKQGRQVKKIEPSLTAEQLKAKADEEERQKAAARTREEQARKDRALIQSYTSENEIDLARNRAVSTLEAQIKSAQSFSDSLTKQQKVLAAKRQSYGGKPLPIELERESASVDAEISSQNILIRQKQEELAMVTAKYDTIKQRWHEIMADKDRATAAESEAKVEAPPPAAVKTGAKRMTNAGK